MPLTKELRGPSKAVRPETFAYVSEDDIDEDLICSVCFAPFLTPVMHDVCGNTFCEDCVLNQWVNSCPSCRGGISRETVHVNRMAIKLVEKLEVSCQRCNEKMQRKEVEHHMVGCVVQDCPAGCGEVLSPKQLESHRDNCSARLSSCPGAPFCCARPLTKAQLQQHLPRCIYVHSRSKLEEMRKAQLLQIASDACSRTDESFRLLSIREQQQQADSVHSAIGAAFSLLEEAVENAVVGAKWMEASALLSSPTAPHTPASIFLRGCCADALGDEVAAMQWLLKACTQGEARAWLTLHMPACQELGSDLSDLKRHLSQNSVGFDQISGAVDWLEDLVDSGNAWGQYVLGSLLQAGVEGIILKDEAKAVELYHKASEGELAAAQNALGVCFARGLRVAQSHQEATRLYRLAAAQGSSAAQNNLGSCYTSGAGVEQDFARAVSYFQMAADASHGPAQYNLGLCYFEGNGIKQDKYEAVSYFCKAAQVGDADAQYNLAWCYRYGQGTGKDIGKAVQYYRLAAEKGNVFALYNLGMCYAKGRVVDEDRTEAARLFRLAAEKGDADSIYMMGLFYSLGEGGLRRDTHAARGFWEKAAAMNHASSRDALRMMKSMTIKSRSHALSTDGTSDTRRREVIELSEMQTARELPEVVQSSRILGDNSHTPRLHSQNLTQ